MKFIYRTLTSKLLLWDWMITNGGKDFCTNGLKTIADGAIGSIGISPEVKILDAVVSIATNTKSDEAFMQISGISQDNFATVYQIMMSEIRRAEMVRVFNKIGTFKVKLLSVYTP